MSDPDEARYGIKKLTPQNWLEPDKASTLLALIDAEGEVREHDAQTWAARFLAFTVTDSVPEHIRNMLEGVPRRLEALFAQIPNDEEGDADDAGSEKRKESDADPS